MLDSVVETNEFTGSFSAGGRILTPGPMPQPRGGRGETQSGPLKSPLLILDGLAFFALRFSISAYFIAEIVLYLFH